MREGGRFTIKGGPRRWATTGGLGRRARDVVLDGVSVSHRENVFGRPPDQRLVNFGCLTSILGFVCSLGSKGFSVGARAASIELFQKWHSRHAVLHEGFRRVSRLKTSRPIDPLGIDGSTLRSGRTTRWWCQSNLLPKTCARRTCTSETFRAR